MAKVWDELQFTPFELRQTSESVIGFGRTEGRCGENVIVNSVLWIVRVVEGQIAALEVFQAEQRAPIGGPPPAGS